MAQSTALSVREVGDSERPAFLTENPQAINDEPRLAFFLDYWRTNRRGTEAPLWSSFVLREVKQHLGWVVVVDVLPGCIEFRYRVVGTRVADYFLGDGTGRTVREAFAGTSEALIHGTLALYGNVCTSGVPLRLQGPANTYDGVYFPSYDSLYLPYSTDGEHVDRIVLIFTFNNLFLHQNRTARVRARRVTPAWDLSLARKSIDSLKLSGSNGEVARYWLSLWTGNEPPTRERFDCKPMSSHLPAVALFEVTPEGPVICRLAGPYVRAALGFELEGQDLIALTPPGQREQRIRNTRKIVDGAISFATRHFQRKDSTRVCIGEIALPFADVGEDGGRAYLFHSAWRPDWFVQYIRVESGTPTGLGDEQAMLSILRA